MNLPERYREHATRPDTLVVCVECSGNPEAVIPLAAVPAHEDWHNGTVPKTTANGEWPRLDVPHQTPDRVTRLPELSEEQLRAMAEEMYAGRPAHWPPVAHGEWVAAFIKAGLILSGAELHR